MTDDTHSDPLKFLLSFQKHIMDIHDALSGFESELKSDGKGNYYFESTLNPHNKPICSIEGAKYIMHHIQLFMNQHSAFSDMSTDDIATLPGDAVKQPIDMMLAYPQIYLVGETDAYGHTTYPYARLKTEGYALYDMLYMYFTALRNAGIKEFALGTIAIRYAPTDNAPQEQKASLYGGGNPFKK